MLQLFFLNKFKIYHNGVKDHQNAGQEILELKV